MPTFIRSRFLLYACFEKELERWVLPILLSQFLPCLLVFVAFVFCFGNYGDGNRLSMPFTQRVAVIAAFGAFEASHRRHAGRLR